MTCHEKQHKSCDFGYMFTKCLQLFGEWFGHQNAPCKKYVSRIIFHNPNLRFNLWGNAPCTGSAQVPFIVNALSMVVSNWESTVFRRFFRRWNPNMRGLGFVFPSETDVCCFGMIWNPIFFFPFSNQYLVETKKRTWLDFYIYAWIFFYIITYSYTHILI